MSEKAREAALVEVARSAACLRPGEQMLVTMARPDEEHVLTIAVSKSEGEAK